MKVKCPICKKETEWEGNEFHPFCSERCKLIDLGKWASEEYRISGKKGEEDKKKKKNEKGLNRPLRKGYTTGACAAAAAKAATLLLLGQGSRVRGQEKNKNEVEIPFPDGSRVKFKFNHSQFITQNTQLIARASVIKDAGDDPDITNGAEIAAEAEMIGSGVKGQGSEKEINLSHAPCPMPQIIIKGGRGVGVVTKPGLAVPVGEPAINPVPMKMIREAVMEAVEEGSRVKGQGSRRKIDLPHAPCPMPLLEITISVPKGVELAKRP